jgi:DNA-binding MarR family transcriptional regulator
MKSAARLDQISQLIFGLSRQLKELTHDHRPVELSMLHLGTLYYVAEHQQPLMSEIAKHLCIKRPSATSLVNGLVASGYLQRLTDRNDRRSVRLDLTPQGKKTLSQGFRQLNKQLHSLLATLNTEEQKQFIAILTKLTNRLHQ